jgi:hypothetical protein
MIGSILFGFGLGGAVIAACWGISYVVAKAAEAERDEAWGDWPYQPEVFPPQDSACFHSSVNSDGGQYDHAR